MDYTEKCKKPIPIGNQKFAYQCEDISLQPIHGAIDIRAYKPRNYGKEPYPNAEANIIQNYDLKIERFTGNCISVCLTKEFRDGTKEIFLSNLSFADFANRLFENYPANNWIQEAPKKQYE